ncbi:MAG: MATE family efflux transporter [Myxococcota bacterium]
MTSTTEGARVQAGRHAAGGLREVALLATPVVLQQLSATLMGVVDSAMVGRLGPTPLAAVGFGSIWLWTIFSLFYGTATGVQTFVSQYDGAGRQRESGPWIWQGLYALVPAALVVVLLAAPLVPALLALLGPSQEMQGAAAAYVNARLPGEVAFAGLMVCTSFYRGIGDTRTPMLVTFGANLVNAVLDYGLIFGKLGLPEWGVAGAGTATAISSVLAALLFLFLVRRRHLDQRFATRPVRPDWHAMRRLLRTGLPIGGQWCVGMTSFAFFTTLVARMGDESMAASQAFVMLLSLSFMQAVGISVAASTLVGRYVGARDLQGARQAFRSSVGLGVILGIAVAVLFVALPGPLLRIFTDDPTVVSLGRPLLLIGAVFQLFDAIAIISEGALRGAGDTRVPFLIETAFGRGVFVPLAYTLGIVFEQGLAGAWLGGAIALAFSAGALVWRFRAGVWERVRI